MSETKKPACILVVDDEERNRRLLVAMLEVEGYATVEAPDGVLALELARQSPPDIVLLDVMMPGMDGYEVARALKADAATSAIPVVMVTALADRASRIKGLEAGAEEFISKPVDRNELQIRVRNLLRLKEFSDHLANHNRILETTVTARTADLRESERRLSDMLANVELAAVMLDREARITYCNEHLLRMTGWRREEVIGQSWVEKFIPPDTNVKARLATLLTDRPEARHGESVILTRSGERLLIRWNNSLLRSAAGDVNGTASIGEDITEQRRSEEALRRFSAAMDATADAIYLVDRASMRFIHVNAAACRMQSRTREEMLALGPDGVLSLSRAELERTYDAIIASGVDAEPVELLRTRKDGSQVWVELRRHAQRIGDRWTIVTLVRDVTERKAAEARIVRLNRVYAVLSGINTAIVRIRERDELFREVCRIAVSEGGFSVARVLELDAKAKVRIAVTSEPDSRMFQGVVDDYNRDPEHSQSLLAIAMRERQAVISNDVAADLRIPHRAALTKDGNYALALLPIIVDQRIAGTVVLRTREPGAFDDAELHLLLELVSNLSFALEHIEKARKLDRLTRVNAMLSGINTAIVRIRDRQALFEEACRIAVETGCLTLAWIGVVNGETNVLVPVAWVGPGREYIDKLRLKVGDSGPRTDTLGAQAIREKRPAVSNDVAHDPRVLLVKEMVEHGMGSMVVLPLVVHGKSLGTLTLVAAESGFFDDDEMELLSEVAANIAFALEHIEKEEKVERLTRVYAVLSGINTLIVRVRDRDELFREACRIAVEAGQFRICWLGLVEPGAVNIVPVASAGTTPEHMTFIKNRISLAIDTPMGDNLVARAVREKKPFLCNDTQNDPGYRFREEHAEKGTRSVAVLPLVVANQAVGVLALYADETGFFDDEEMKLLRELAGDIAFAINHLGKRDRLDYLAYYDPLTGLANRRLFLERTAQYMRSASASEHKLAVFLIDLERFRNINDSLGRPAGDALLKQVAEWMTLKAGDSGLLARVGADQFAVVLPEVKQEGSVARLIQNWMDASLAHPFRLNDAVFRIAAKVGVALFPEDGADADLLFRNAEAALKKAKTTGQRYLFYTQTMTDAVTGKLTMENQLRQALDNEEFVLHYQPKVNLQSDKLIGVEALIRWNDPLTGLVPPGRFIPILEETGMIQDVGRWALRKAIEDYLRWRAAGLPAVRIAVNVSPLQLHSRGFIAEIEEAIGIDPLAAAGLELEITESVIMEDVKHNIASLRAIRAMGVTIAIDDFGTGFSSLSYLARLPVDTLKIDRSFVIDMTEGPQGLALVSTIISLAHALKLKVVAEGVETEEQARLLRLLSCDEMQGFLFSKPVPAEIFEARFLTLRVAA